MPAWAPPGPHPARFARFGPGPPAFGPMWKACGRAHKEPKLAARFIRELSIFDGTQMAPATKFTKIWRLKNVGECPWPEGTRILFVGGDQMGSDPSAMAAPARVMPGDEVDVALDLVAPTELGRYVGYWRLAGPYCRRKFGHRVWCHIHVVDPRMTVQPPSEQEMAEVMAKQEELLHEMGQEMDADAAGDGDGGDGDATEDSPEEPPVQPAPQPLADELTSFADELDELSVAAHAADDSGHADGADADGAQSDGSFVEVGDDIDGMHPPAGISATVAAQLGAMGFTDEETVRLVIQRNHAELEACARDLASLSEWEHIVDDLAEMGFEDRSLNMEVLLRHDGSLKGAVKELVAHAASK